LRKFQQIFEQRKRNRCCKMATTIPYAYLRRKTLDAARRAQDGERPRSGRANARGGPRYRDGWRNAGVAVGAPKLFAFTRGPKSQWKSIRASNAIVPHPERAEGGETAAMSFWCLLASGQITNAKIEGWRNLAERPFDQIIDLGA
jgi:hypothetical protein